MPGFYQSKEWNRLRAKHLKHNPACVVKGCGKRAVFVDHIVTVKNAPNRRLDPSNLQSLCKFHHGVLTAAYDRGTLAGACDESGMPIDPNHPWNQSDNTAAIDTVNRPAPIDPTTQARLKRRHSGR
jgi:hypothetical protein